MPYGQSFDAIRLAGDSPFSSQSKNSPVCLPVLAVRHGDEHQGLNQEIVGYLPKATNTCSFLTETTFSLDVVDDDSKCLDFCISTHPRVHLFSTVECRIWRRPDSACNAHLSRASVPKCP